MISLGQPAAHFTRRAAGVVCVDGSEVEGHLSKPWMRAYLSRQVGKVLAPAGQQELPDIEISEEDIRSHTAIVGATGWGKSRAMLYLVIQQVRAGCSLVVLDKKHETIDHYIACLNAMGFDPKRVHLLLPAKSDRTVPGLNLLDAAAQGIEPEHAIQDFIDFLREVNASWGPRLRNTLASGLSVVTAHRGLSLLELVEMLQRDDYRAALVASAAPEETERLKTARKFFQREFPQWPRGERATATGAVTNKLLEFLYSDLLRDMLCAGRTTLHFSTFWEKQQVLLVHLDETQIGNDGARLLGGLLGHWLFASAMRRTDKGKVPVVLAIDELGALETFVGEPIYKTLTQARSQNIRMVVATQHLYSLSRELRTALLANAAVRLFFRLGPEDAKEVAESLSAAKEGGISHLVVAAEKSDRKGGVAPQATLPHPVLDPWGRPVRVAKAVWERLFWEPFFDVRSQQLAHLKANGALAGLGRLYVRAPDTGEPQEITQYVAGLRPADDFWLEGPEPLRLVVRFPRPKVVSQKAETERDMLLHWRDLLEQRLPRRHALLRRAGCPPCVLKVRDIIIPPLTQSHRAAFVAAARAANSLTAEEIAHMVEGREASMEEVCRQHALSLVARRLPRREPPPVPTRPQASAALGTAPAPGETRRLEIPDVEAEDDGSIG